MIIKPKIRGFICTTAHPLGCYKRVSDDIEYAKRNKLPQNVKTALVIGSSTGYGLASRIALGFGAKSATVGVMFEKEPSETKTASAGWYNTAAFSEQADALGVKNFTINGDAYSKEVKDKTTELLKKEGLSLDMVVYSLAAPRRKLDDGSVVSSVLKTVGTPYASKTVDLRTNEVKEVEIPPADREETENTVKVMGGEDWLDWIKTLSDAGLLNDGCATVAYSYIGPEITHPIYKDGTIGKAKDDLNRTARIISNTFAGVRAYISVNKALVTQSSAAIPIVPLYISILYKIMKQKGVHEGCIEQMVRLYGQKMPGNETDSDGRFRLDDFELKADVQSEVMKRFSAVDTQNLSECADIEGYNRDFLNLFGFDVDGVDYNEDVNPVRMIPNLYQP